MDSNGRVRIGTSGWVYKHWLDIFYPRTLPNSQQLSFYAQHFDTVEINYSFYRLPGRPVFEQWRAQTPPSFLSDGMSRNLRRRRRKYRVHTRYPRSGDPETLTVNKTSIPHRKECIMTHELRWRILSFQIIVILVLAFGAGMAYWAHNFTQDQVKSQLVAQQIVFPAATSASIKALPAADAKAMSQYAGQTMSTGDQAQTYANHFIAVHLNEIGQGKTYSYWSGKALAEKTSNPKQYAIDEGIAQTLFQGTTLRSMLLNAWAFWFVGQIALYAAIGLTVGFLAVFGAFLYELLVEPKREGIVELSARRTAAVS